MKVLSYIIIVLTTGFSVAPALNAQNDKIIDQIRFSGVYTGGLDLNDRVTSLNGLGAGFEARFRLYDKFTFSLHAGYSYLHVEQPDPIEWWGWDYWEIYYRTYLDVWTGEGIYGYEIEPMQRVELYPVLLTVNYALPNLTDRLSWSLSVGGGVFVFENRLFTNEYWWKEFPDIDYIYEYNFSNNAPSKHGTLYGIVTGINATYRLWNVLGINFNTNYNHLISSMREHDFAVFPYGSSFNISTGIVLFY